MLGSILGSRAAMRVMSQAGSGRIFLLDGAGATGGATPGTAVYGASKRALTQFKVCLRAFGPWLLGRELLCCFLASSNRFRWY